MGPPSYMLSVVDRNVVMRRMTVSFQQLLWSVRTDILVDENFGDVRSFLQTLMAPEKGGRGDRLEKKMEILLCAFFPLPTNNHSSESSKETVR